MELRQPVTQDLSALAEINDILDRRYIVTEFSP